MTQMENYSFPVQIREPAGSTSRDDTITIAVAVPIYAEWEWKCLLSTLAHVNWKIRGRTVSLKMVGQKFAIISDKPVDIEFVGVHSAQQTVDLLSTYDILYCAQKFDGIARPHEEIRVPVELPYFLASGRPVLIHAPQYAASSKLLLPYSACATSQSHEAINNELYNAIDRLTFDSEYYETLCRNGNAVIRKSPELFATKDKKNSFVTEAAIS